MVIPRRVRPRCSRAAWKRRKKAGCRPESGRGEDLVGQPLEGAVIDDRQDAERAVVQLVGGDVAGEVLQAQSR